MFQKHLFMKQLSLDFAADVAAGPHGSVAQVKRGPAAMRADIEEQPMFNEMNQLTIKDLPQYQRDAIQWLDGYRNTQVLQELLSRHRYSEEEIRSYRSRWGEWLKAKEWKHGVH